MYVAAFEIGCGWQADRLQGKINFNLALRGCACLLDVQRFPHDLANGQARTDRFERFLKNHLDFSTGLSPPVAAQFQQILSLKEYLASIGLINPMLAYFWSNAARELDINVSAWNLSMSSPAQIAVHAAEHPNPDLRKLWQKITIELAQINAGLLGRIANQLRLSRSEYPENERVAEQIEGIIAQVSLA